MDAAEERTEEHPTVELQLATLAARVETGDDGPTKLVLTDGGGRQVELVGGGSYNRTLDGLRELIAHTRDYQQTLVQRHLEDHPPPVPPFSVSGKY